MNESLLAEHEDRWIMNLRGLAVTEISITHQLFLRLDSDARVVLGCPFELTQGVGDGRQHVFLDPERQDVAAALGLFGAKVLSAVAFKTGLLRLVFDNGCRLDSRADPSFEAWEVLGPAGWRVISMPGGKLAVWSGPSMTSYPPAPRDRRAWSSSPGRDVNDRAGSAPGETGE